MPPGSWIARGLHLRLCSLSQTRSPFNLGLSPPKPNKQPGWIHSFGNALTRAWNRDSGRNLAPLLTEAKFIEPSKKVRFSGVETARAALDEGRLLDLARSMREWGYSVRPNESLSVYQPTSYPNDVYQLGEALTRWHGALLEMMSPPEPFAAA